MAKAATSEKVKADIAPVDFKKGLDLIRNRIAAKKNAISSANGEIAGVYKLLEDLGINKQGARIFQTLDKLEDIDRRDVMRTLNKLGEQAGWNTSADIVDLAEGKGATGVEMPAPSDDDATEATIDLEAKLEPAAFKAAIVDTISSQSDLAEADAYVLANRIFDDLTTKEKKSLNLKLAGEKAEAEMADWEDEKPAN